MSKIFSQNDPQWKFQLLGKNTDPHFNIGNYGCLITSLANACQILGISDFYLGNYGKRLELNPSWLDDDLTNNSNGYADFGNYVWGSLDRAVEQGVKELGFMFKAQYRFNEFKNEIKTKIDSGKYVCLIEIDSIPATSTQDQHWVLIKSIDGDNVTIIDAWDGQVKPLSSYYGATVFSPNDTIYSAKFITREVKEEPQKTVETVNPCQNQDNKIEELNRQLIFRDSEITNLKSEIQIKEKLIQDIDNTRENEANNRKNAETKLHDLSKHIDSILVEHHEMQRKYDDQNYELVTLKEELEKKETFSWEKLIKGQLSKGYPQLTVIMSSYASFYAIVKQYIPDLANFLNNNQSNFWVIIFTYLAYYMIKLSLELYQKFNDKTL